jgi:hypothetical protein
MEDISLIEALKSCTTGCSWCVHHCPDEDKYENLVTCIRIQKGLLVICKMAGSILDDKTSLFMKKLIKIFEKLSEVLLEEWKTHNVSAPRLGYNYEISNKLPGCSHIFLVSQLLEQTYLQTLD